MAAPGGEQHDGQVEGQDSSPGGAGNRQIQGAPVVVLGVVPTQGLPDGSRDMPAILPHPPAGEFEEALQSASPGQEDASGSRPRGGARYVARRLSDEMWRRLGVHGEAQVRYPPRFKTLLVIVLVGGTAWVGNYLFQVLPMIEGHDDSPCKYNDSQLTYNAKMLFVYFLWFAVARLSLFMPCIAARVALVQSRTHGFCRTYCVHLVIRDGPLYIFVVGSMLFWFHLMQSPGCEQRSPPLYQTLKLYAIYSCMVSVLCLFLAYWHNKLLLEAARDLHGRTGEVDRSAPAGTLEQLETLRFDPELFGDEEGKLYPSECAICLAGWEPEDVIKATACHHAFHEECIGNWLKSARTCALCRQDLTKPLVSPADSPGSRSDPEVQTIGAADIV